jgi:glycosyltransferase 2 family protein
VSGDFIKTPRIGRSPELLNNIERICALDLVSLQKTTRGIRRLKSLGGAFVSVVIGAGAIYALTRALKNVDFHHVFAIIRETNVHVIALALALVAGSYAIITLYDWLALHTMGRKDVPYRIAALASFTSFPIAHCIGAVALISPIIRYRIYSRHGLGALGVANVCFITGVTFWLGNMTALGLSLLYEPAAISVLDRFSPQLNRFLALVLLCAVGAFVIWSWIRPRVLGRNRWQVRLPSGPLVLLQIVVGLLDLTAAAVSMYVLLPAGLDIGLFRLIAVFIAATLLGFASHAPAGLGVFDATIMIGLGGGDKEALLAALLLFRLLYHFVPLSIALLLFGGVEVSRILRGKTQPVAEIESLDWGAKLQTDNPGNDQREAKDPKWIGRLAVKQNARDDTADGANARPYRVSGAKGQ